MTNFYLNTDIDSSYLVSSSSDGNIIISLIKVETNRSEDISSTNTKILSTWFENDYTISTIIKLYDDKVRQHISLYSLYDF